MSVSVPSILQTYIPFLYPIVSAFPVRFSAFPHKRNNTLSCPQRKKRAKTPKGTLYCPVHSLSVYTKRPICCPQIRFLRINGAKKGITICPSYYVSVSERDNILSPLCTVYLRERDNIMSLSVKERRIKGTILLSLSRNMCVRGILYCPSYYVVFERIVH